MLTLQDLRHGLGQRARAHCDLKYTAATVYMPIMCETDLAVHTHKHSVNIVTLSQGQKDYKNLSM